MDKCKDILSTAYGEHGKKYSGSYRVKLFKYTEMCADKYLGAITFSNYKRAVNFCLRYTKKGYRTFATIWEYEDASYDNEYVEGYHFKESYRSGKLEVRF